MASDNDSGFAGAVAGGASAAGGLTGAGSTLGGSLSAAGAETDGFGLLCFETGTVADGVTRRSVWAGFLSGGAG